jgi:hypothetical protein
MSHRRTISPDLDASAIDGTREVADGSITLLAKLNMAGSKEMRTVSTCMYTPCYGQSKIDCYRGDKP